MPDPGDYSAQVKISDGLLDAFASRMDDFSQAWLDGKIDLADWQISMREELRREYALQLIAAANKEPADIDPKDWLRLGTQLKDQYGYLEDFARQLYAADQNPESPESLALFARMQSRARMYANSSREAFWKQAASDLGINLPAHPGDGSTTCLTNCHCQWRFEFEYDADGILTAVLAYWDLDEAAENCPHCVERSQEWNPLRIEVGNTQDTPDVEAA